jgi:hypothetical protein
MAYRPLQFGYAPSNVNAMTTMSPMGVNKRTAQQFLDTRYAIDIRNYELVDYGRIIKRKGMTKILEEAGNLPITMFKRWKEDVWLFGFGTTVMQYRKSTNTTLTIKDDFASGSVFDGAPYGEFFFVVNGIGKMQRIAYSDLSVTEVANSPTGAVGITIIGSRCYTWVGTSVYYSGVDDGTDPPFANWTVSTTVSDGGKVSYRNAGDVKSVVPLGEAIVVFSDKGFYTFVLTTIDSAGVLKKVETITKYQEDFGGARGAINTPIGVFYVNEAGLWQMTALGTQNVPYSKQEKLKSVLLGSDYFRDVDLSSADLCYDINKNSIYVSCAKESSSNNVVIVHNLNLESFSFFTNWNISRFMTNDNDVYMASSTKTAIYKLFDGATDDGLIIGTVYKQELKVGDLETRQDIIELYTQGWLSPSSVINVRFDAYSDTGRLVTDKSKYEWTAQYAVSSMDSYNSARYSSSVYNGDIERAGLVECFDGARPFIRNIQRLILNITSGDKYPHELTWVKVGSRVKAKIRRRKLNKII